MKYIKTYEDQFNGVIQSSDKNVWNVVANYIRKYLPELPELDPNTTELFCGYNKLTLQRN